MAMIDAVRQRVIGAFGVIGLFIGPVTLAVAYTLLIDWMAAGDAADEPGRPASMMLDVAG